MSRAFIKPRLIILSPINFGDVTNFSKIDITDLKEEKKIYLKIICVVAELYHCMCFRYGPISIV